MINKETYKRLTAKKEDRYWEQEEFWQSAQEPSYEEIEELYSRLANLEDKIMDGTLVELPCKVGDTVYIATKLWDIKEVVEAEVACIEVTADEKGIRYRTYLDHEYVFSKTNPNLIANRYIFYNDEFFLTKAEAEARLKELQENKK